MGPVLMCSGTQCCWAQIHRFACPGDEREGLIHAVGKWLQLVTLSVYNLCLSPYHLKEGWTHIKSFFSYRDENHGGRAGGSGFFIDTPKPHNTPASHCYKLPTFATVNNILQRLELCSLMIKARYLFRGYKRD